MKGCTVLGDSRIPVLDELRERLSRRQALGGVLGMAALALTAEANAKKGKNKNKKKRCRKGKKRCSGKCRDLQTDVKHCGSCGNACAEAQNCVAGVCSLPCQEFACISNQIDAKRPISSVSAMPDGDLAMLVPGDSQILILTTLGERVRTVGSFGTEPGEFWNPMDLAVGLDGTCYVAEYRGGGGANAGRIQAIPPTGEPVLTRVDFARNVGAGLDADAYYGGDWWFIHRINEAGVDQYKWGFDGGDTNASRFDNVTGLAVTSAGKIIAINGNNPDRGTDTVGKVYSFTDLGTAIVTRDWVVGGLGSGPGKFNNASGVSASGDRLFIADTDNRRVQVLNAADGAYLFEWSTTDRAGNLIKPESITVHPDGTIYVTADEMIYGYTLVS
jgi:hypothetical protein